MKVGWKIKIETMLKSVRGRGSIKDVYGRTSD
jgi:hypothetical protein